MRAVRASICLGVLLLVCSGAGAKKKPAQPPPEHGPAGAELYGLLTEFADRYALETSLAWDAMDDQLETLEKRTVAWERQYFNLSAMVEFATQANPDEGLLAMMVLVTLERIGTERYFIPEVFGEVGRPYHDRLVRLEQGIWALGRRVMTPAQLAALGAIVADWEDNPPDYFRLASFFRLAEDSEARVRAAGEGPSRSKGLFSSVRLAAEAADEAKLLGERLFYFAIRAPMLAGIQAEYRIRKFGLAPIVADRLDDLNRGVEHLEDVTESARIIALAAGRLEALLPEDAPDLPALLDLTEKRAGGLLTEVRSTAELGGELMASLQTTVESANALAARVEGPLEALGEMKLEEVRASLADVTAATAHLEAVMASAERLLASDQLAEAAPQIAATLDQVGGIGEDLIDRAFGAGVKLIVIFLVGLLITLLAYRYLAKRI